MNSPNRGTPVQKVRTSAYRIPTDFPEADGTIAWQSTVLVLVEVEAGGRTGLGFTYADKATAVVIDTLLSSVVEGREAMDVSGIYCDMVHKGRNMGRPGIVSMAVSAVDIALWDLKARLLDLPLVSLLGAARESVPIYGSGGFTSYPLEKLRDQLGGWAAMGISRVKMKIGSRPAEDVGRVKAARQAIGRDVELFVDANGAYDRKQALAMAEEFSGLGVRWFEEPVSSDDLEGLRLLRDRAPASMEITAGEYGYDLYYFRRMLDAGAVDVLMADATRCGGVSGFLGVDSLCRSHGLPLSGHTSPSVHLHPCCACPSVRHFEYFHDHTRIEQMLFDGVVRPVNGIMHPDRSRPGIGLDFKRSDAEQYAL